MYFPRQEKIYGAEQTEMETGSEERTIRMSIVFFWLSGILRAVSDLLKQRDDNSCARKMRRFTGPPAALKVFRTDFPNHCIMLIRGDVNEEKTG